MKIPTKTFILLVFFAIQLLTCGFAEDQALLIGISVYEDEEANLFSASKDTTIMEIIAKNHLNFNDNNITTITDEKATLANVELALKQLVENSTSEDSVLIFYSGHGVQKLDENGDEPDGCDESFYLHDMQALTDDVFFQYLILLEAKEILVIIDSSFKGTLSFDGIKEYRAKTFSTQWEVNCKQTNSKEVSRGVSSFIPDSVPEKEIIVFTAATDDQLVYDGSFESRKGSYFTQSIFEIVSLKENISFVDLQNSVQSTLRDKLGMRAHTPKLDASDSWKVKSITAFNQTDEFDNHTKSEPPVFESIKNYDQLIDLMVDKRAFNVEISSEKSIYILGELLELKISTPREGYLYIFDRGADQALYLLFPNQLATENYVRPQEEITVPGEKIGGFEFTAIEPIGKSRIFAIVTNKPLNLLDGTVGTMVSNYFTVFEAYNSKHFNEAKKEVFDYMYDPQTWFGGHVIELDVTNN